MVWPIKHKTELHYYSLLCINVVHILWWPADCNECCFGYNCQRRASDCFNLIYIEAGRNKLISYSLHNFILNPLTAATSNPL